MYRFQLLLPILAVACNESAAEKPAARQTPTLRAATIPVTVGETPDAKCPTVSERLTARGV